MRKKISFKEVASVLLSVLICVGVFYFYTKSGSLIPPGAPASTMFSLSDIAGSGFASTTHSLVQIKEAVDAATTAYITTLRGQDSGQTAGDNYPAAYCPTGWTIVTSWNWSELATAFAQTIPYCLNVTCYFYNDYTETLCSK